MLIQTFLGDRLVHVIIGTELELKPSLVVSGNFNINLHHLSDVVVSYDDAICVLPAGFMFPGFVIGVATHPTLVAL